MAIDYEIKNIIKNQGFITIDKMMRLALSASQHSYYQHQRTIGTEGDFITSPEISQLFGEIIGLWTIEQWIKLGRPKKTKLVELGPGRGLLMRDILRVARLMPDFYESLVIELIDINQNFIELQKANLAIFSKKINWSSRLNFMEGFPTLFITNEFFDALPIKQFIKSDNLWYEVVLKHNQPKDIFEFDKISLGLELQQELQQNHANAIDGAILEKSQDSLKFFNEICKILKRNSGAGLFIDYGYCIPQLERTKLHYKSTLQAVKNHQYHPLLKLLGMADLSAHVDFYDFIKIAEKFKLSYVELFNQGDFLKTYGINFRANLLNKILSFKEQKIINNQVERLTSPTQMGNLFKVLCINEF